MGRLALVMGSKSVSSKPIHAAAPVEDYDGADPTHQTVLKPTAAATPTAAVATALSEDQAWQAMVSVHVYHRTRVGAESNGTDEGTLHSSVADVRIQIVPATQALSLALYREAHYRIELKPPSDDDTDATTPSYTCQLVFGADKRFLLLRLAGPGRPGDLILFQLRKPRAETIQKSPAVLYHNLPRPTYLPVGTTTTTILPVATQPKVILTPAAVTAMCQGPDPSTFWIGTASGTLHVLAGRPTTFSEALSTARALPRILQLDWKPCRESSTGHLCVLDVHQQVHVVTTRTTITTTSNHNHGNNHSSHDGQRRKKKPMVHVRLDDGAWTALPSTTAVHRVAWLASTDYIVTVTQAATTVTCTVWTVPSMEARWVPCRTHALRKEEMEGLVRFDDGNSENTDLALLSPDLHYDAMTETLALRACFVSDHNPPQYAPVGVLWSWRTNVQGWKQTLSTPRAVLYLARQPDQAKLVVTTTWPDTCKLRKEVYNLALLSPPSSRVASIPLALPNPLVLAATSVWYPRCTQFAGGGQEQIEWMELPLPVDYMTHYGTPTVAAWSSLTSTLAVVAQRGVLVSRKGGKWQQFSNSSAEERVQVLAMAWWDGFASVEDDAVLVALMRIQPEGESSAEETGTIYLTCWSSRFLDSDKQLLIPVPSYDGGDSWGMALPHDMGDEFSLELLCEGDKAVVLAWSAGSQTPYRVYQLQIVPAPKTEEKTASYQEHRPFSVLSTCIATGSVESCSKLWLASTSFGFDLVALRSGKLDLRLLDYVATLGVWRQTNGLVDALAISPDTVVAVGEVCSEPIAVVVDLWLADRTDMSVSWTLLLSNGKLVTWKLSVASKPLDHVVLAEPIYDEQDNNGPRWVNDNSRLVGKVCATESTSAWMQGAGRMTSHELCLGRIPGGRFGFAIAAGQSCRQMHRMLGEDFESEIFLSDFLKNEVFGPGDLVLLPPLFLSPLYMTILENPVNLRDYLNLPVTRTRDQSAILLALRLLIFVSVDRMATNKASSAAAREARTVFQSAVAVARDLLGRESLRFVAFIIELARQLEPSRFEHFLPLPPPGNESIGRLLEISSMNGSISLSLATLPLLTNKAKAEMICASTFRLCLSACMKPQSVHHPVRREASEALSDLFRFGLKLVDTEEDVDGDNFVDRSIEADLVYDDSSGEGSTEKRQQQYSMFCGISRIFGGSAKVESRKTAAADSFIDHGFKVKGGPLNVRALGLSSSAVASEGVTDVVADMLHTLLLDVSHLMLWGSAARMASLLLPDSLAGLHLATKQECTAIMRDTSVRPIRHILPKEFRRKDGLVDFFSASISRCMDCLDDAETSLVVDLLRVVLKRKPIATDREAEHRATLLLVLLVVGHTSGRLSDLLEEDVDHLILESFHKALKGPEPKPPPAPESTCSDDELSEAKEIALET